MLILAVALAALGTSGATHDPPARVPALRLGDASLILQELDPLALGGSAAGSPAAENREGGPSLRATLLTIVAAEAIIVGWSAMSYASPETLIVMDGICAGICPVAALHVRAGQAWTGTRLLIAMIGSFLGFAALAAGTALAWTSRLLTSRDALFVAHAAGMNALFLLVGLAELLAAPMPRPRVPWLPVTPASGH